jgi:hypothetical protein
MGWRLAQHKISPQNSGGGWIYPLFEFVPKTLLLQTQIK